MKASVIGLRLALFLGFLCLSRVVVRSAADDLDRKIAPSDTITIEVFGEKDLTVERRVQKSGKINYPLLGIVGVAGKTTSEVADDIQEKLGKDYLVNPVVSVTVKEYRLRTVSVLGQVEKSGPVLLPSEVKMEILEAIASAGGFSKSADKNRIELTRDGKTTRFTLKDLQKAKGSKEVWLEPGDLIYVNESLF